LALGTEISATINTSIIVRSIISCRINKKLLKFILVIYLNIIKLHE
jgi:hypothetical protein